MKKLIFLATLISSTYLLADLTINELPQEYASKLKCMNTKYLINSPSQSSEAKPMLIFLHGIGKRGSEINILKSMAKTISKSASKYGMITVLPQCTKDKTGKGWWVNKDLSYLLKHLKSSLKVNDKRIYVVGFSMGGFGTWDWAMSEPKEFAAIAPIAGGSKVNTVSKIKNLPIWAFHGKIDKKVPYERSKSLMDKLKTSKVAKLTTFEDEGHGIVMQVLRNPKLYDWLSQQSQ